MSEFRGKIAILDVDDTLADLKQELMETMHKETGKHLHWSEWGSINVDKFYGVNLNQFLDIMLKHDVIDRLQPHEESKEVLDKLRAYGFRIVMVTARGWHPTGKDNTVKWLEKHHLPFDEVITVPLTECKVESIRKFGRVHLAVDDNTKHVEAFAKSGIVDHSYLYNRPWNKTAPKKLTKIDTLHGIFKSIER